MRRSDPLALAELAAVIEEATTVTRHGLRNKLGSIRNAAFYIRRRLSETEAWAADPRLDTMASLLETDVATANELLGRTDERLHTRNPEHFDIKKCVLDAAKHARTVASIRIEVDAPPAVTHADFHEVAMAIRCVVENAAEAMPDGGLVRVLGRIDGGKYHVDVLDGGTGIDDSLREAVLRAWYTTKVGHLGLGLNIAQRVVQRYGGKLTIGRSPFGGTLVSLSLEIAEKRQDVEDPPGGR